MSNRGKQIPSSYFDDDEDIQFRRPSLDQSRTSQTPTADRYYRKIKAQVSTTSSTKELSSLDRIAIGIIIILMAFWTLVLLALTFSLRDSNIFLGVLVGTMGYWGFTWLMYYVGWKFYWILLALGWLLGTGYALTMFGVMTQSFMSLF